MNPMSYIALPVWFLSRLLMIDSVGLKELEAGVHSNDDFKPRFSCTNRLPESSIK